MHFRVSDFLEQLEQEHVGDPVSYLWEFAPVHEWWHMRRMADTQPIGFLTFHHIVLTTLGGTFPQGSVPVESRSPAPYPQVIRTEARSVNSVGALQEFSDDLEGWHNGVHNAIGGVFAQARRNVFLRSFWQFHRFIDDEFGAALNTWGKTFDEYLADVSEADQRLV